MVKKTVLLPFRTCLTNFTRITESNFQGESGVNDLETGEAVFLSAEYISQLPVQEQHIFESLEFFLKFGKVKVDPLRFLFN